MAESKKCMRHGCHQQYVEEENSDTSCTYHPGWPVFHDRVKKWTCCTKESWDWDEFMKIQGCTKGRHSEEKPQKPEKPKPSQTTLEEHLPYPITKTVDEFNSEQQKTADPECRAVKLKKPFVTAEGRQQCCNKGCHLEFDPEENTDSSCRYHPGVPIFRDTKKSWSCCNASSYDWDEFMKIPSCTIGRHIPKMVDA